MVRKSVPYVIVSGAEETQAPQAVRRGPDQSGEPERASVGGAAVPGGPEPPEPPGSGARAGGCSGSSGGGFLFFGGGGGLAKKACK
jgi:hypothetical protein